MSDNEKLDEKTAVVMSAATNAMTSANAFGAMFQALIGVLRDNNILSQSKIEIVYRGAAAQIDAMEPANDLQRMAQHQMREIVERSAEGAGIQIPPPGQTGMPRRH